MGEIYTREKWMFSFGMETTPINNGGLRIQEEGKSQGTLARTANLPKN